MVGPEPDPLLSSKIEDLDTFKYLCLWSFINKPVFMSVCSTYTQSIGIKIFVKCSLLRSEDGAAPSSLVQQKILGLLLKLNLTPPIIYFQKSVKYKITHWEKEGYFLKGVGIILHVSIFSLLEFIIIAIWKDTGWLWVDGIIAGRSC